MYVASYVAKEVPENVSVKDQLEHLNVVAVAVVEHGREREDVLDVLDDPDVLDGYTSDVDQVDQVVVVDQ